MPATITSIVDTANAQLRKHESLSSGCSMHSWRRANNVSAIALPFRQPAGSPICRVRQLHISVLAACARGALAPYRSLSRLIRQSGM